LNKKPCQDKKIAKVMRKENVPDRVKAVYKILGKNISIQRINRDMEISELITKSGVSRPTVYAILKGKSISVENLVKLADALNVHPGELFFSHDEKQARLFRSFEEFKRYSLGQESANK